jgi:alcohol dehydrogenase
MLLKNVLSGSLSPRQLITHEFQLDDLMSAYATFSDAANQKALKMIIRSE